MFRAKYLVPFTTDFTAAMALLGPSFERKLPRVFVRTEKRLVRTRPEENILEPVLFRAQMHEQCAHSRFYDTASSQLLLALGISINRDLAKSNSATHTQRLAQCQWVDQQALTFLKRFPEAQGIELCAGLSTRFHRLSQNLDWPRFFWHSVNDQYTAPFLTAAFPKSDHFYICGCHNPLSDWTHILRKQNAKPTLLIIDSQTPLASIDDWQVLCRAIRRALQTQTKVIHLIAVHSFSANKAGIDAVFCDIPNFSIQQVARFAASPNSLWKRISTRLFGKRLPELSHFVCELT